MNSLRIAVLVLFVIASSMVTVAGGDGPQPCCGPCICILCVQGSGLDDIPKLANRAGVLFVGKVVKAEVLTCCDKYADITFSVSKIWKGGPLTSISVRYAAGCADLFPFVLGREYLVVAGRGGIPGGLFLTDSCAPPMEASAASEHIKALEAWRRAMYDGSTGG